MKLDLVDPPAVAVMGAQDRGERVGLPGPFGSFGTARQSAQRFERRIGLGADQAAR
jgi:hypothetical protein